MDETTQDIILTEIRAMRDDLREYGERTATLEAQIYPLIGNGQPGKIAQMESSISRLIQWRWWVLGASSAVAGMCSLLAWVVITLRK